jgi:predicted transcriptional regulator
MGQRLMSKAYASSGIVPNAALAQSGLAWIIKDMNAQEVIEQIKHLPPAERAQVTRFVVENDDSWIPEEFKQAMRDAEEGRFVDMETALHETPPPRLQ